MVPKQKPDRMQCFVPNATENIATLHYSFIQQFYTFICYIKHSPICHIGLTVLTLTYSTHDVHHKLKKKVPPVMPSKIRVNSVGGGGWWVCEMWEILISQNKFSVNIQSPTESQLQYPGSL